MYDYLIVGAGLYGAVFAHEAALAGNKVKIIEKRNHIGGNIYTEEIEGIHVHKYGAHIFHTNDSEVWTYIQQFATFNRFTNSPIANFKGEIYNLPFNMNTFNKLWNVSTPNEAMSIIETQREHLNGKIPINLEEQAISLVGTDIYKKLIKGYTEKQWGRSCQELPPFIIKRLPVRFTYDNNYFNDKFQGIPIGGYTKIIEKMLEHPNIEVYLDTDYFEDRKNFNTEANKIIYTGMIDQFFEYKYGHLEYRSLDFKTDILDIENYQGNAVINYTDKETPYTRVIEHKHFEFGQQDKTVITYEFPKEWEVGSEPYYPINDEKNANLYKKYYKLAQTEKKVHFGGRLGLYKYFDMHQIIKASLYAFKKLNN
ncbi:UDP-galactopyranose mutase [Enterococcus olivae]